MAAQGGFDLGFVTVQRLVIMMAFRLSRLFQLWLLVSLETPPDHLHFVPLFLKLFCLCKFGLLFFFFDLSGYHSGFLLVVPNISLGGGVSLPVSRIGTSLLLLCLFRFKVLRGSRACLIEVRHFL